MTQLGDKVTACPSILRCFVAGVLLLSAACTGPGGREPKPVYVTPNLPSDQLASVFIQDDKDNFIFVELDAVATIEEADGLVVDAKEVLLPPGRHVLEVEVHYPWRGLGKLATLFGVLIGTREEDEDEDEEPEPPSRYDEEMVVDLRAGHRYEIKYSEDTDYSYFSSEEKYVLDLWLEDVTGKSDE